MPTLTIRLHWPPRWLARLFRPSLAKSYRLIVEATDAALCALTNTSEFRSGDDWLADLERAAASFRSLESLPHPAISSEEYRDAVSELSTMIVIWGSGAPGGPRRAQDAETALRSFRQMVGQREEWE